MAEIHTLSPGARILCVDDEPSGLYFRKLILENAGYRVETATNAIDAIRSFRSRTFALVITDSLLGRQSGTTMTAEMRQMRPQVPIIVLSGAAEVPSGLGLADAFLSKTEGEHLLQKVRELLQTPAPAGRVSSSARAAAALMEPQVQQILLAALVDSSDDAVFSKTLGGIILTWNRAAERMYGYTATEMIGKPVAKLVPEEKKGELQGIMQRIRRSEKVDHLETQRIAKDGRILTISLTISPICDAKGNLVGAATTARDITEVRMAEQALRTSDRLAMTGRMAATVAHEINNPLEAVTNILYLLGQSSSLDATAREFLSIAERELAQIRQIAQLTLKFHRQSSSRWGPVSLNELVDSVLALYGRRIRVLGIAVELECRGECKVEGNATELRQVVSNLIVNAVDALEQRGERLHIRIQDARDGNHRSGIRLTIADDGPGIPASHLRSIFQPFYSTKGEKGTGLGLSVSRSIVEKHGGSLRMRSSNRPGRSGTTFSVFFPNEAEVARLKAA